MQEESEPIYDDNTLQLMKEHETAELIIALVKYAKTLETMVVELRGQVKYVNTGRTIKTFS